MRQLIQPLGSLQADRQHDVPGLVELMGGKDKFEKFADAHFDGGHNLHTNEPSHHIVSCDSVLELTAALCVRPRRHP